MAIPGDDSDEYIEGGPDQPAFLVFRKIPSGPTVPSEEHHSLVEPFNTSSLATPDRGSGSNSSLIGVNLDLDDQSNGLIQKKNSITPCQTCPILCEKKTCLKNISS